MYYHGYCHWLYDLVGDNGSNYSTHVYYSLYDNHDHNGDIPGERRVCVKLEFT